MGRLTSTMRAIPAFGLLFVILLALPPAVGHATNVCVDRKWFQEPHIPPPPSPLATEGECPRSDREVPDPLYENGTYTQTPFDLIFPGALGCTGINDCAWEHFWDGVWDPYVVCLLQTVDYPISTLAGEDHATLCTCVP